MFTLLTHPIAGTHPIATVPFRFDDVDTWIHRPAPTLGQHSAEVLAELGYSEEEIEALAEAKIIGETPENL